MNRLSLKELVLNFTFLLLLQLPLIHRITLFGKAFGFFYVGFLFMLPVNLSRSYLMIIGFASGLMVDVFSNTPGIHAAACVFVLFIRNIWLAVMSDDWKEIGNLNINTLKWVGFALFVLPLTFIHHFIVFTIENGGFLFFGDLLTRIFLSTLFSFSIILIINLLVAGNQKRL